MNAPDHTDYQLRADLTRLIDHDPVCGSIAVMKILDDTTDFAFEQDVLEYAREKLAAMSA